MASLWNLPVIYFCENNLYGMGTAVHKGSSNPKLYSRGDVVPGIRVIIIFFYKKLDWW